MIKLLKLSTKTSHIEFSTGLFDERTFFEEFINDLKLAKNSVLIESPFITSERMKTFIPVLNNTVKRGVKIFIVTRNPKEHTSGYALQAETAIQWCENSGIQVLLCDNNHHRKLAIIDKKILWEGSLNILSQTKSREIMRKIENKMVVKDMIKFLEFDRFL